MIPLDEIKSSKETVYTKKFCERTVQVLRSGCSV